jgi:hypothetical protein
MKQEILNQRTQSIALAIATLAACAMPLSVSAYITGPYAIDAYTMHLWHLDEAGTPAVDQAHYTYTSSFTPTKDANQPLNALFGATPATLGNSSYSGFGTALSTVPSSAPPFPANSVQPGLGALTPANGTADNVDHTFDNPTTHAFTMEAIIKIAFNPTVAWSQPQEIIAGEGDASDSSDRSWQFRIEANTTPGTTAWKLRFQKVSGFGGVGQSTANWNVDANIPTTGINAIVQDGWFHVAVTYDGSISNASGLNLYWTALDPANTQASLAGSGMLNGWLREQDTDFALGNEMRDFNGNTEPFNGLIDEVRISDIARASTDFLFAVPEPSTLTLCGMGFAGLIVWLRRKK